MNSTPRFDPVRHRFIEALAQRAAGHGGEVRRILDARLAALRAAYECDLDAARNASHNASHDVGAAKPAPPRPGLLAELVAPHARPTAAPELKALRHFRSTWAKLSADRRLTESLARVPEKAGPLNSNHLLHRSLALMRDLSPEYLHRFMAHADALLWIDRATGGDLPRADASRRQAASVPAEAKPAKPVKPVKAENPAKARRAR